MAMISRISKSGKARLLIRTTYICQRYPFIVAIDTWNLIEEILSLGTTQKTKLIIFCKLKLKIKQLQKAGLCKNCINFFSNFSFSRTAVADNAKNRLSDQNVECHVRNSFV
jgi:hypothetical protein